MGPQQRYLLRLLPALLQMVPLYYRLLILNTYGLMISLPLNGQIWQQAPIL